jgi:disulfide bond formation protein DsbB
VRYRANAADAVGLLACAGAAWTVHGAVTITHQVAGECGRNVPCPSGTTPRIGMMVVCVLTALVVTARGRFLVLPALFWSVGAGLALAPPVPGTQGAESAQDLPFLVTDRATGLLLMGIGLVLLGGICVVVHLLQQNEADRQRILHDGVPALGTVLEVRDTGRALDDRVRLTVDYRVEPLDGSRFFTTTAGVFVSQDCSPVPGHHHAIMIDPNDRSRLAVLVRAESADPARVHCLVERAKVLSRLPTSGDDAPTTTPR